MSTDLLVDLERLGDLLERMSDRIVVDQIEHWDAFDMVALDDPIEPVDDRPAAGPRRWRAAVALATAAALVGALWVATSRPGADPQVGGPGGSSPEVSGNGHMTLDALPAGWFFGGADIYPTGAREEVERIYATDSAVPETLPAFTLLSIAADAGEPVMDQPSESVTVQGAPGRVYATVGDGQRLAFGPVGGYKYLLVGYHVSRDQLLAAANTAHQSPDGYGAVLDGTALPQGVSERGAGIVSELWFISRQAATQPIPEAHWTDGNGSLWYRSFDDPAMPPLGRFGFESVTDTTVNGHPAYAATGENGVPVSVMWSDGVRTFLLASNGLTASQLQSLAATLRPATDDEWAKMTQGQPDTPASASTTTLPSSEPNSEPTFVALDPASFPGHALVATSPEWNTLFQQAYQIQVQRCMQQLGFAYNRQPLGGTSPDAVAAMAAWESGRDGMFASVPGYQDALYGTDTESNPGCQLAAFPLIFDGQIRSDQIAANTEASLSGQWSRTAQVDPRLADDLATATQCLDQAGYAITPERDLEEARKKFEEATGKGIEDVCPSVKQLDIDMRPIIDEVEHQWLLDHPDVLSPIQARYAADIVRFKQIIGGAAAQ
jgi:hypothetical protein